MRLQCCTRVAYIFYYFVCPSLSTTLRKPSLIHRLEVDKTAKDYKRLLRLSTTFSLASVVLCYDPRTRCVDPVGSVFRTDGYQARV